MSENKSEVAEPTDEFAVWFEKHRMEVVIGKPFVYAVVF